jgi:hypothetical protein
VDCIFATFDRLYANGARRFVLMNLLPLYLAPMYTSAEYDGNAESVYWPGPKPRNMTEIYLKMKSQVLEVNGQFKDKIQRAVSRNDTFVDAQVAHFDVHELVRSTLRYEQLLTFQFMDMFNAPSQYLNGTQPFHVTGSEVQCLGTYGNFTCEAAGNSDSWLWRDELHPSQQFDRVLAREVVNVVSGTSKYAEYYAHEQYTNRDVIPEIDI